MGISRLLARLLGRGGPPPPPLPSFSICYAERCAIAPEDEIAIVDPASELTGERNRAYAYLSFTEIRADDTRLADLPPEAIHRRNPRWDTWVVDPAHPAWEPLLLARVEEIVSRGFSHLFMDTVDGVDLVAGERPRRARETLRAAARLFRVATGRMSGRVIMNRGFSLYPEVRDRLHGILVESYFFKFEENAYARRTKREMAWLRERIAPARDDGKILLALDYAALPPDEILLLAAEAAAEGVSWRVAREDLQ